MAVLVRPIRLFDRFVFSALSKAHAGTTAVLVDKYDALTDQDLLDQIERSWVPRIPPNLDVRNRIPMQTSRRCQVSDGPI
jgi:hypothetical protein